MLRTLLGQYQADSNNNKSIYNIAYIKENITHIYKHKLLKLSTVD